MPKIDWSSPDYIYPTLVLLGCAVVDSAWQACPAPTLHQYGLGFLLKDMVSCMEACPHNLFRHVQVYLYWLLGCFTPTINVAAHMVGVFKCVQSAGATLAWGLDVWGVSYPAQVSYHNSGRQHAM